MTRLLNAGRMCLGIHDVKFEVRPSRLTVGDLWTLLPLRLAKQHPAETSLIKDFVGSWLVDKVK